eukprot:g5352.t1
MQRNVLQLYRELLRSIRLLPRDSWTYYRRYLRENFKAHAEEEDTERVQLMIKKARQDAEWVLKNRGGIRAKVR